MIIPIGHEEDSVRRLPWVTFGVMLLCLAGYLGVGLAESGGPSLEETYDHAWEAFEYYLEHPYLTLDPTLAESGFGGMSELERESLLEAYRSEFPPPDDSQQRLEEQRELDRLTERALANVREHPYQRWGLVPAEWSALTFLTHMFLHGGLLHLLGNMLILYLAGPFIEDVWGRPLFAAFYVIAGIVAALAFLIPNADSTIPMIGASGAIAAVMGAFLIRYWNTRIKFFYIFGLIWRGTFSAAAWVMLPLWFGEQLFMAAMTSSGGIGGGIAYWAHVGGFAFGVAAALAIRHWRIEERYIEPTLEGKIHTTVVDNAALDRALAASAAGSTERALELLAAQCRAQPGNHDVALAYWGVAVEAGRAAEAAPAVVGVVRDELRGGHHELALDHWSELVEHAPHAPVDAEVLIRIAQAAVRAGNPAGATPVLRRAMLEGGTSMPATMALRIARLASGLDANLARGAARLALTRPDLGPHEREQAQQLLA